MMPKLLLATLVLILAGCGQPPANPTTTAAASSPASTPPPPKPTPTPETWRAAFDSSFHVIGQRNDAGGGVTKFDACFDAQAPAAMGQCKVGASGEKDGFRKLWIFTPRLSGFLMVAPYGPYVASYVSVRENKSPKLLLSANYIGSDWLFMNKLAVMVDGDVILEQNFDHSDVKTHVGTGEVEERVDFVLTDAQVAALHKIHTGSKVVLRLTGKQGYVSFESRKKSKQAMFNSDTFTYDIQEALAIYVSIAAKTQGKEVPD